jgi:hypothetical protein
MKCKNCGLDFTKRSAKIYCSNACQKAYEKKQRYQKIEAGLTEGIGERRFRDYLIEKHGAKCMRCGWDKTNPVTGCCPIELEHLDGNSQNNKLDNLCLLCPNCHSLTATYKALNKGNGRYKRRLRYTAGKSS